MLSKITSLALLCAALASGGCFFEGDRHVAWERSRSVIGPIAVKNRVAYVDTARDRVIVLDATDGARVHGTRIGRNAIHAVPTPDREYLAVITRGEEAIEVGQVDQEPLLWMVDLDSPEAAPRAYSIGSPFDRLAIAASGEVAVAYYSSEIDSSTGLFRNPNELAIIDLTSPPSDENPVLRTVRSFGSAPDGVILSPPMVVPGAEDDTPRIFAFVLALDTLTILDATNPDSREVTVRIGGTGNQVRPREIVFAPNTATAYLRSDNARDVLAILLEADAPDGDTDNDYRPVLAELGAGGGPADVAVYDDAQERRFVLAGMPSAGAVAVIDGDTGAFVTVPTPDPIDRVMLFPSGDGVVPRVALLASLSARVPRVHLLSLESITDELVPIDLRTIELSEAVLDVVPVPGSERAMIVHDDARTVLGLLDIEVGSVSPLQGVGRLDSYDFDDGGQHLIGVTRGVERVGFLDLASLHPFDTRLDDAPETVFSLANGSVLVDHGDPLGRATLLPYAGAPRDESVIVSGFLLSDLLDERF